MQLTKLVATRKVDTSITASALSMWPCKNISHIQVLVITFFPTPPLKLNQDSKQLELGRLLIATHLDQSNYLANQKKGIVNKYDLTVLLDRSWALKSVNISGFQHSSSGFTGLEWWTSSKISRVGSHTEHWYGLMRGINFWTYQLVLVWNFLKIWFQPIIDMGSF